MTYSFSFTGPSSLVELFAEHGLTPNVALTAWDSDVIKKYVREGLGVGILANVAIDGEEDGDLKVRDGSHLFPVHTTWVGFRRGVLLRSFMYEFLQMLAPHLTQRQVSAAENTENQEEVDREFAAVKIPFPALIAVRAQPEVRVTSTVTCVSSSCAPNSRRKYSLPSPEDVAHR